MIRQDCAVIVVDIISTGTQVRGLINACANAGTKVLGIISLCDFSEGDAGKALTFEFTGGEIEHLTFVRAPQVFTPARPDDAVMDPETLTIKLPTDDDRNQTYDLSELSQEQGLKYLDVSHSVLAGHFELFGRHFDYAADVRRLVAEESPVRGDVLRACERALFQTCNVPVAIVLYPDLSDTHLLLAQLESHPRIQQRLRSNKLRILEARRGSRARGRRLTLTPREIEDARAWADAAY